MWNMRIDSHKEKTNILRNKRNIACIPQPKVYLNYMDETMRFEYKGNTVQIEHNQFGYIVIINRIDISYQHSSMIAAITSAKRHLGGNVSASGDERGDSYTNPYVV